MSTSTDGDAEVDGLYALEPGEFVTARDALARRMRAEGRKDEAAAVAKLRRPSVVAAALNRVARDEPDRIEALVEAAATVARAQQDLLDGGDADALREATADQRGAARAVVAAATEIAGAGQADAVRTTLDAAVADPELSRRLRSGTLTRTLAAPAGFGFGFDTAEDQEPTPRRSRRRSAGQEEPTGTRAAATAPSGPDADARAAADAAAATAAARKEARSVVARLERELARAERWAARAGASAIAAAQDQVAAAEALAAARQRLDDADAEQQRAEAERRAREDERDHQAALLEQARALLADLDR